MNDFKAYAAKSKFLSLPPPNEAELHNSNQEDVCFDEDDNSQKGDEAKERGQRPPQIQEQDTTV